MKTKEELNALKEEIKDLYKKLSELSEVELEQVTGGTPDISRLKRDIETQGNVIVYNSSSPN